MLATIAAHPSPQRWSTQVALGPSGLALTYALSFTALAKYCVNYGTRADAMFASVQRLESYAWMASEDCAAARLGDSLGAGVGEGKAPAASWPDRGELVLLNYQPEVRHSQNIADGRHP